MPELSLDDPAVYERADPERLRDRIEGLADQIETASAAARQLELPAHYRDAESIAVLGMGGSGIGGSLLQALTVHEKVPTPVYVVRGYEIPAHLGPRTLVLASSYSGNTEETVAAFAGALDAGAMCVAIASGGRLVDLASKHGVPVLAVEWDGEPRAALGWSYMSLVGIAQGLGLLGTLKVDVPVAARELRDYGAGLGASVPEAQNIAKQMARRWYGKLVVTIGSGALTPVAYRWRTQINENGKSWAVADELPEMNHNAPLGYGAPRELLPLLHVVFLQHAAMHPRVRLRVQASFEDLAAQGVAAESTESPGSTALAQQLCAIHLGDWASYYLGVLNGVNPSSMAALDRLKHLLASRG
jgi:glucose/mannose-6-phosphate isomerase